MFKNFLLVGLGGAIGSMLRYAISLLVTVKQFPYGTFIVNIAGSFIIGAVLALSLKNELFSNNWKIFLATGICGGFTTFSAFAAENMALLQSGKYGIAFIYIMASLLLGIAAVVLGFKLITPNS
ncbi:fluoride efflux transporter CrcB [Ferruginibacter sp.]|nr:fluoride efflux transporter CrcB [Ferruginibacter sp.]